MPDLDALATPAVAAHAWLLKGAVAFYHGEEGAALQASTRALSTSEELGDPLGVARARLQLAALHTAYGRLDRAELFARAGNEGLETAGNEGVLALGRYRLLCAMLERGRLQEAGELVRQLENGDAAGAGDDLNRVLLAALARGRYHLAAGDPETAIAELEAALAQLPPGWLVPYRFEARLVLAAAEKARPDEAARIRRLRALSAEAGRTGFVWFAREADRHLAEARQTS